MLILANLLLLLAFLVHTFVGDREIRILRPEPATQDAAKRLDKWVMTRCGWHWVSLDLLVMTVVVTLINLEVDLPPYTGRLLAGYLGANALVWLLTLTFSPGYPHKYWRQGQWLLLLVIAGLLWFGTQ